MFGFGDKKFIEKNPVPHGYEKYMGLGAILVKRNQSPAEVMAMKSDKNQFKTVIADSWGIKDTNGAKGMIEWLLAEGHRAKYEESYIKFKNGDGSAIPPQNAAEFKRLVEVERNYKFNPDDAAGCRTVLAWDLERAAFLARSCAHLGYISEEEAFDYIINRIYPIAKEAFSNWSEYAISLVEGRTFCYGGNCTDVAAYVPELLKKDNSVWAKYPLQNKHNIGD